MAITRTANNVGSGNVDRIVRFEIDDLRTNPPPNKSIKLLNFPYQLGKGNEGYSAELKTGYYNLNFLALPDDFSYFASLRFRQAKGHLYETIGAGTETRLFEGFVVPGQSDIRLSDGRPEPLLVQIEDGFSTLSEFDYDFTVKGNVKVSDIIWKGVQKAMGGNHNFWLASNLVYNRTPALTSPFFSFVTVPAERFVGLNWFEALDQNICKRYNVCGQYQRGRISFIGIELLVENSYTAHEFDGATGMPTGNTEVRNAQNVDVANFRRVYDSFRTPNQEISEVQISTFKGYDPNKSVEGENKTVNGSVEWQDPIPVEGGPDIDRGLLNIKIPNVKIENSAVKGLHHQDKFYQQRAVYIKYRDDHWGVVDGFGVQTDESSDKCLAYVCHPAYSPDCYNRADAFIFTESKVVGSFDVEHDSFGAKGSVQAKKFKTNQSDTSRIDTIQVGAIFREFTKRDVIEANEDGIAYPPPGNRTWSFRLSDNTWYEQGDMQSDPWPPLYRPVDTEPWQNRPWGILQTVPFGGIDSNLWNTISLNIDHFPGSGKGLLTFYWSKPIITGLTPREPALTPPSSFPFNSISYFNTNNDEVILQTTIDPISDATDYQYKIQPDEQGRFTLTSDSTAADIVSGECELFLFDNFQIQELRAGEDDEDGITTVTRVNAIEESMPLELGEFPAGGPYEERFRGNHRDIGGSIVAGWGFGTATSDIQLSTPRVLGTFNSGSGYLIAYNKELNETIVPMTADYTLTVGGSNVPITNVDIKGSFVFLETGTVPDYQETISLSYSPGANPITDTLNQVADAFTGRAPVSQTPQTPNLPLLGETAASGYHIVLMYTENLNETSVPSADDFAVAVNTDDREVANVSISSGMAVIELEEGLPEQGNVYLTYTKGTNPLEDASNNEVDALMRRNITRYNIIYDVLDDDLDVVHARQIIKQYSGLLEILKISGPIKDHVFHVDQTIEFDGNRFHIIKLDEDYKSGILTIEAVGLSNIQPDTTSFILDETFGSERRPSSGFGAPPPVQRTIESIDGGISSDSEVVGVAPVSQIIYLTETDFQARKSTGELQEGAVYARESTVEYLDKRDATPGEPTALATTAAGTFVDVSWAAPVSGARAFGYTVEWRESSSSGAYSTASITDLSNLEYAITGLNVGTDYNIRVRADGAILSGDYATITTTTLSVIEQTETIGDVQASSTPGAATKYLRWSVNVFNGPMNSNLLADPSITAYLGRVDIANGNAASQCIVFTDTSSTGQGGTSGPQMHEDWEGYEQAIVVRAGSLSLTLPGPNHADNFTIDGTEPYTWRVGNAKRLELNTFVEAYHNLSQSDKDATTLTLQYIPS